MAQSREPGERDAEAAAAQRALDAALAIVSREFATPDAELRARSRRRAPVAFARQVAAYLAHVGCSISFTALGAALGRDRTTVAHAARRIEDARDNADLDARLDRLEAELTAILRNAAQQARAADKARDETPR